MKKILLFIVAAVTALCATAQTYHAITDGEVVSFAKANVEANDWIGWTHPSNYSNRTKCVATGEEIPNISKVERVASLNVSGCASFEVTAEGNSAVRHLIISVDGVEIANQEWANGCNTYGPFETGNTGNCTITIGGSDGSIYLSSVTLFAPTEMEVVSFKVAGEQMTVDNEALTITGTVNYAVDLATTTPEVVCNEATKTNTFDGNYNGGKLTLTNDATTKEYTVTVTNRVEDTTAPQFVGVFGGEVNLVPDGGLCPVHSGTIRVSFDEDIEIRGEISTAIAAYLDAEENTVMIEGTFTAEGKDLVFTPAERLLSNTLYLLYIDEMGICDIEGNYITPFGGIMFKTEQFQVTVNEANAVTPEENFKYIRAMKFTFDAPITLGENIQEGFQGAYMTSGGSDNETGEDDNMGIGGGGMGYILPGSVELSKDGKTLYITSFVDPMLGMAPVPDNATVVFYAMYPSFIGTTCGDVVAANDYGFAYSRGDLDTMSEPIYTMGSNAFSTNFDAPINDTYIMPSWVTGTAGVRVDREYAGKDMPAGNIGAIRANPTDTITLDIAEACTVTLTVSATGTRTFAVCNEANEVLVTIEGAQSNTQHTLKFDAPAGKIRLYTIEANGGFTVQGIRTEDTKTIHTGLEKNYSYYHPYMGSSYRGGEVYDLIETPSAIIMNEPFRDLIGYLPVAVSIKLTKGEGDTYVFDTQKIYEDEEYGEAYYLHAMKGEPGGRGGINYVPDSTKTTINYTWKDNTLTMEEGAFLGVCVYVDGQFQMLMTGESNVVIGKPQEPLKNIADAEDYILTWGDAWEDTYSSKVKVKIEENNIYLGNLPNTAEGTFVKGEILEGNKVRFDGKQYTGIVYDENYESYYHTYFCCIAEELGLVDYFGEMVEELVLVEKDSIVFDYNPEKGTLSCTTGIFIINQGKQVGFMYGTPSTILGNEFRSAELARWIDAPATPADPKAGNSNATRKVFSMYAKTVNDGYIDVDKLYYNIYFDNKIIDLKDYTNEVTESTINIPYNLNNGAVYQSEYYPEMHYIELPDTATYTKVGVQMVYFGGGEERRSNIIYEDKSIVDEILPFIEGVMADDVDLVTDGALAPVYTKEIRVRFNEPITVEAPENAMCFGVDADDNELACPVTVTTEGCDLVFTPAERLYSNATYGLSFGDAIVKDVNGNEYVAMGWGGLDFGFMTEQFQVTVNEVNPVTPEENFEYIRAMKFTFDAPIILGQTEAFQGAYMATASEDETGDNMGMGGMGYMLVGATELSKDGKTLYITNFVDPYLGMAPVPDNATVVFYAMYADFLASTYGDAIAANEFGFAYSRGDLDEMSPIYTTGSNAFRIDYNAPINDTYIMPSWISGTAYVDREYAGEDMPEGTVGAIRGTMDDPLIVDVAEKSDIIFTVSSTEEVTMIVGDENENELASMVLEPNTPTEVIAHVENAGKIFLASTGNYTVQGLKVSVYSSVKTVGADTDVRYAAGIVYNNGNDVEVFNMSGICVARSNENIDLTAMPEGVYILRINNETTMKVVR